MQSRIGQIRPPSGEVGSGESPECTNVGTLIRPKVWWREGYTVVGCPYLAPNPTTFLTHTSSLSNITSLLS